MSYIVLARKYRPQSFDDIVGQLPVSQTLLNALESGRIAHAYIFSGPRGVGKTTTARILAKCLNCLKGPTTKPCNQCEPCRSIAQGASMDDVLEIDGASNRGIEQIRELRDNVKYAPAQSRYRIYIIDEAHQITKDAFGALLKTLEEPPAHAVFMMATTEVQKIPPPILSRCQRFSLKPISPDAVLGHLKKICAQEKVKIDEPALKMMVRFVEGSLRDALSLLDQALVFSPEGITVQTIRDLLGLLSKDVITGFADAVRGGNPETVLQTIQKYTQEGIDLTQLGKDLQSYYHQLLLAKAGVFDTLASDPEDLKKTASTYDFPAIERGIRLLSRALEDMRHSETPRAIFEIYALRLAQKTLDPREFIERLEKLENGIKQANPKSQALNPKQVQNPKSENPNKSNSGFSASNSELPPSKPAIAPTSASSPTDLPPTLLSQWADVINDAAQVKAPLATALEEGTPAIKEGRLVVTFFKSFHQQLVMKSLDVLCSILSQRFNQAIPVEILLEKENGHAPPPSTAKKPDAAEWDTKSAPPSPAEEPSEWEDVSPQETSAQIQQAVKHFPGTLRKEKKK